MPDANDSDDQSEQQNASSDTGDSSASGDSSGGATDTTADSATRSSSPVKLRGKMLFLDPQSDLIAQLRGVNVPSLEKHTYVLVDDDAKECRVISEDELEASYVDNNMDNYVLQDVTWLTLDIDNQYLTITYSSGVQTSLLLGSIELSGGGRVEQYAKSNGVIYPIDDSGYLQLDATNTPYLVAIRTWYENEAKRVNDERIKMAEMVHGFAENIAGLAGAGHLGQEMTGEH